MPLESALLKGNARLEAVAAGGPSIKAAPPADDDEAVIRIQLALVRLGFALPKSFPDGPNEDPDGKFGPETTAAVIAFQKQKFPGTPSEWDGRVGPKTLAKLDEALGKEGPPRTFIIHDVRLFGWPPNGDNLEVNGDTPLQWLIDMTRKKSRENNGNLTLKIMAHGLPGFVQCGMGAMQHPTLPLTVTDPVNGGMIIGPGKGGISIADLPKLRQLRRHVKRIEFHSCLVARIGPCFEANGHVCFDGNLFCFRLAQTVQAEVMASIHLQYYWKGTGPTNGMHFGNWNGRVFTWAAPGNISAMQDFPYTEMTGPPPPGTLPT
jgi:hypothetical protein